ncbi:MAG: D-alanyl-lipoteichoic acid biosynthesis protein DltD [Bacteroidota bacterium]
MKFLVKYHILPLFAALVFAYLLALLLVKSDLLVKQSPEPKIVSGTNTGDTNCFFSLAPNEKLELALYGSLREKNGITLFGSSELSVNTACIPYAFLPDSLGIRTQAFGQAFQQHFAIYCQLLAFKSELKDAKICIILSPGWFEEEGTNIEGFLEFVRPNFLKRIASDQSIPLERKLEIGRYLQENYSAIVNPGAAINYFVNLYRYRNVYGLNDFFQKRGKEIQPIRYVLKANRSLERQQRTIDWGKRIAAAESLFVASVHNAIYVNDSYFNEYIKQKDGSLHRGTYSKVDANNNRELEDFRLLVNLLAESGSKPTFVIQGMNPYHYQHLDRFDPLLEKITAELDKNNIPYLRLFTSKKANYQPGSLIDIMHMGDVSWLKMNKFLAEHYGK